MAAADVEIMPKVCKHAFFFSWKTKIISIRIVGTLNARDRKRERERIATANQGREEIIGRWCLVWNRCAFWLKKNSNHIIHSHSVLFSSNARSVVLLLLPFFVSFTRVSECVCVCKHIRNCVWNPQFTLWNYGLTTHMNELLVEPKTKNHFPYTHI